MEMVSLKSSEKERKRETIAMKPSAYKPPPYPYGTRIELRDEHVKAFPGLQECEVGQEIMIQAKAKVVSMSENASADMNSKRESCCVEFQLTKISLDWDKPKKDAKVSVKSKGGKSEYTVED